MSRAVGPVGNVEADVATHEDRPTGAGHRISRVLLQRAWLACLACLVLATFTLVLSMRTGVFSPLDEQEHVDYMDQLFHGHLVRHGDLLEPATLREISCRGLDFPGYVPPPCNTPTLTPLPYPAGGYNTVTAHPPGYYAVTGVLAEGLQKLGVFRSIVTAARAATLGWFLAGVLLTWLAMAEFGVAVFQRTVILALIIVAPTVIAADTRVTNDATALAVGAGLLWALARWERGAQRGWPLVAFAALAAVTKSTNCIAVGVVVLYLLLRFVRQRVNGGGRSRRDAMILAVQGAGIALLLSAVWVKVSAAIAVTSSIDTVNRQFYVDSLGLSTLIGESTSLFTPVGSAANVIAPLEGHQLVPTLVFLLNLLFAGACVGAIFWGRARGRLESLGVATLGMLLVSGPVLSFLLFHADHLFYRNPARYGLSTLPMLAVLLGRALEKRVAALVVAAFTAPAVIYTLVILAGA